MGLHEQVVGSGVHLEGAAGLKTGENGGKRGKNGGKRGKNGGKRGKIRVETKRDELDKKWSTRRAKNGTKKWVKCGACTEKTGKSERTPLSKWHAVEKAAALSFSTFVSRLSSAHAPLALSEPSDVGTTASASASASAPAPAPAAASGGAESAWLSPAPPSAAPSAAPACSCWCPKLLTRTDVGTGWKSPGQLSGAVKELLMDEDCAACAGISEDKEEE